MITAHSLFRECAVKKAIFTNIVVFRLKQYAIHVEEFVAKPLNLNTDVSNLSATSY